MPDRAETMGVHRRAARHLAFARRLIRQAGVCFTPLCLINGAAAACVAITSLLAPGGSAAHIIAGGIGAALVIAGLFWAADHAGGRPGLRLPALPLLLTALSVVSLAGAVMSGVHLAVAPELDVASAATLHGRMALLALLCAPLGLAGAVQLRLARLPASAPTVPTLPLGAR
ncbi:hypothetical protein AncyloWKF20_15060 [Ancylobacter sp. WKF20]|uniref:hypothetical protein n=1 Tax=Ancylobacter sp. WKF20 TaxID=3039801 RepID=UPI0024344279|nr:hypothetical protein [Ancylobacter sp. WKF20]WGD29092.1 hypothetical protein AncyloWKF20_15060 [Ancylobacter sp. WKF20]